VVALGKRTKGSPWVPARQDIIWIDCNPQAGQEMRDVRPFLVLSPIKFNDKSRCHRTDKRSTQGGKNQLRTLPPAQIFRLACARRQDAPAQEVAG